jgi:putative copper export protein
MRKLEFHEVFFIIVLCIVLFVFLLTGLREVLLTAQLSPGPAPAYSPTFDFSNMLVLMVGALMFMVMMGYVVYYVLVNRKY